MALEFADSVETTSVYSTQTFERIKTRRLATANRSHVSIDVTNIFGQGRWRDQP